MTSAASLSSALAPYRSGNEVVVRWVDATGGAHNAVVTLEGGIAD